MGTTIWFLSIGLNPLKICKFNLNFHLNEFYLNFIKERGKNKFF